MNNSGITLNPATAVIPNWMPCPSPICLEWEGEKQLLIDILRCNTTGFTFETTRKPINSRTLFVINNVRLAAKQGRKFVGRTEMVICGRFKYSSSATEKITFTIPMLVEDKIEPESEALKCFACFNRFSDSIPSLKPRILPNCGHTVCTGCACSLSNPNTIVDDILRKEWNPSIVCPKCSKKSHGNPYYLPINWNIMGIIQERKSPTELVDDPYVPCVENDRHESKKYCLDCEKPFCRACFYAAHAPKTFSTHTAVPISALPMPKTFCSVHGDVPPTTICLNQECVTSKFCCEDCATTIHRDHEKVNVAEHARQKMRELDGLFKKMNHVTDFVCRNIGRVGNCLESYCDRTAIADCTNAINNHFGEASQAALEQFEIYVADKKKSLKKIKEVWDFEVDQRKATIKGIENRYRRKTDIHNVDIQDPEYQDWFNKGETPPEEFPPLTLEYFNQNILNTLITSNPSEPQGQAAEVQNVQAASDEIQGTLKISNPAEHPEVQNEQTEPAAKKQRTDGDEKS